MPTYIPPPVIYSSNHHHHANEGKEILAFFASIHVICIAWIIISILIAKIKKDKYYDIFEDNELVWLFLGVMFLFDLILLVSSFIYSLL
jgi:uncharacterized protein with PQ loop repeat